MHVFERECVCVCVYPQCAEATESLQHAVVYVLQSVGGQNQLIDPRGSFKCPLLYVSDAIITQVTARNSEKEREERDGEGVADIERQRKAEEGNSAKKERDKHRETERTNKLIVITLKVFPRPHAPLVLAV